MVFSKAEKGKERVVLLERGKRGVEVFLEKTVSKKKYIKEEEERVEKEGGSGFHLERKTKRGEPRF